MRREDSSPKKKLFKLSHESLAFPQTIPSNAGVFDSLAASTSSSSSSSELLRHLGESDKSQLIIALAHGSGLIK